MSSGRDGSRQFLRQAARYGRVWRGGEIIKAIHHASVHKATCVVFFSFFPEIYICDVTTRHPREKTLHRVKWEKRLGRWGSGEVGGVGSDLLVALKERDVIIRVASEESSVQADSL